MAVTTRYEAHAFSAAAATLPLGRPVQVETMGLRVTSRAVFVRRFDWPPVVRSVFTRLAFWLLAGVVEIQVNHTVERLDGNVHVDPWARSRQ